MMLYSFGQVRATMLRQGMRTRLIFNTQHVATQRCDMLRSNVAIVWPELANAGPTTLAYVVLKCCDPLAGA